MLLYKLPLGILLLSTLNIVSADNDDTDTIDDLSSPCLEFAQTCVNLCMEKDDVKSFSSSCAVEASSCKCDGEELAPKVFKNLIELYDNIDPNDMRLQVEEKDANIAPMRMLNLVLEDDVHYDEMGPEDNYANQISKVDDNNSMLEEIKQKEILSDEKKDEEEDMYLEYDDIPNEFDREVMEEQLEEIQPQREASIFCPTFIQRCKDDCPAAPARSSCGIPESGLGYLLVCTCNGVDISSSVRSQVLAETFHSPA